MSHGAKGVLVIGDQLAEQPDVGEAVKTQGLVVQVEKVPPLNEADAGFVCFLETAPDGEVGVEDGVVVCLHCLLDVHPEAGAGLDLAKVHERVVCVDGSWHPVDEELEPCSDS